METVTQGYQPVDLEFIRKQLPKNFKKITNDKDLEQEVISICAELKDLSKSSIYFTFSILNSAKYFHFQADPHSQT